MVGRNLFIIECPAFDGRVGFRQNPGKQRRILPNGRQNHRRLRMMLIIQILAVAAVIGNQFVFFT